MELGPRHAGHPVIAQDRVGRIVADHGEGRRAGLGKDRLVAGSGKDAAEEVADRRLVVEDENAEGPA